MASTLTGLPRTSRDYGMPKRKKESAAGRKRRSAAKEKLAPRPVGRPPLRGVSRTGYLALRVAPAELDALKARAARAGLGVSPFVVGVLEAAGVLTLLSPP